MQKTILLALISFLMLAAAAPDASKSDLATLQGEWKMVSATRDGGEMPADSVANGKRVCKDDITTVTVGEMLIMKAKFTLDGSKNPKSIDYDVQAGPYAGKKQLGIYKIDDGKEGVTVTFCFAAPGKDRPHAFESKAGDGRTLSVWKKSS